MAQLLFDGTQFAYLWTLQIWIHMKQLLLLPVLLTITTNILAQNSNLVFFTQNAERFYVILNGVKQNAKVETNVKVTDLGHPNYKVRVIFEEPALGEVDKTIFVNKGMESVYAIKKNKKEEYVLRFQSEVPVAQAPPPAASQTVIVYSATPPPATDVTVTETTTTTMVTEGTAPIGEQVNVGISASDGMGGVNMNISMNVSETGTATGTGTSTTSTYSTTTTTTTGGHADHAHHESATQPEVYVMPGYNGPTGCNWPMSEGDFSSAKQSISSKSFEDSKLTVAKQIAGANCLLCDQVKGIMQLFDFEDTKLDFAKYVYGYTYDQGNFYKLNDAFDFESSIDELNRYINTR